MTAIRPNIFPRNFCHSQHDVCKIWNLATHDTNLFVMTSLLQLQYLKRKFKQKDLTQRYRVRVLSTDLIFVKLSGYFVHYETNPVSFWKKNDILAKLFLWKVLLIFIQLSQAFHTQSEKEYWHLTSNSSFPNASFNQWFARRIEIY